MSAVARYLLAEWVCSRRIVAPGLVLAGGVVVLYAQPASPALSSASTVLALLFAAQCWLTLSLLNSQGTADRHLLAASAGGRAFVAGRLLAACLLTLANSLLALVYPLVAGRFAGAPGVGQLAIILLANLTATLGAAGLAALFARPLVYSRAVSVLGLTACAILTVPTNMPGGAIATAQALDSGRHAPQLIERLGGDVGTVLVFVCAVGAVCARQWRHRE
jgi:hypothetical protein